MTSTQLSEWEAFDRMEPVCPDWRQDYRLAYFSSLLVNMVNKMFGRPGAKVYTPDDLMLKWGETALENEFKEVRVQSLEEMKKAVLSIAAAFGVTDKNKPNPGYKPPVNANKAIKSKPMKQ